MDKLERTQLWRLKSIESIQQGFRIEDKNKSVDKRRHCFGKPACQNITQNSRVQRPLKFSGQRQESDQFSGLLLAKLKALETALFSAGSGLLQVVFKLSCFTLILVNLDTASQPQHLLFNGHLEEVWKDKNKGRRFVQRRYLP